MAATGQQAMEMNRNEEGCLDDGGRDKGGQGWKLSSVILFTPQGRLVHKSATKVRGIQGYNQC